PIIRNRAKINATVENARAMISASPSLPALAKSYDGPRDDAPRSIADIPSSTPQAEMLAKLLKAQGYRFVGPTSERVRVHAERWHGQRPRPRVLPGDRPGPIPALALLRPKASQPGKPA